MTAALAPVAAPGGTALERIDAQLAYLDTIELELELAQDYDPWTGREGQARPAQLPPPGEWAVWLIMAGRGFGKTRSGAEFVRQRIQSGIAKQITLSGPTQNDTRDIMVEGESGLLAVCDRAGIRYRYVPSKRRIYFPDYGARALMVSADRPDRYRGLQHDTIWADELAAWRYAEDAWTQMMLGLRIGEDPRAVGTTTPRPKKFLKDLIADDGTRLTTGTTYDNLGNLHSRFRDTVIKRYEGTNMGRQELGGELLDDLEGALWQRSVLERTRVTNPAIGKFLRTAMKKIAVAVDPATTYGPEADMTGIAAAGIGQNDHAYVFSAYALRASPDQWARSVINLYLELMADSITAESNQGGEMVRKTITSVAKEMGVTVNVRLVHARLGKRLRAEPVSALWEQGRGHIIGDFPELEDQMCAFTGQDDGEEDDMVDAVVHAVVAAQGRGQRPKGQTKGH